MATRNTPSTTAEAPKPTKAGAYVSPPLKIVSKRANFWRAGVVHAAEAVTHEAGAFTREQVEQLKGEPMLVVEELAPASEGGE